MKIFTLFNKKIIFSGFILVSLIITLVIFFSSLNRSNVNNSYLNINKSLRIGGRFRIDKGLNPIFIGDSDNIMPVQFIYSSLLEINSKGEVVADLAEKWGIASDFKSITFKLKENVFFHNGEVLTAKDVKNSYEKLMDAEISPRASYYSFIESIEIKDPFIITFNFNRVFPNADYYFNFVILPSSCNIGEQSSSFSKKPIGSGPYRFLETTNKGDIVLKRYENYYGKHGRVEFLHFKNIGNKEKQWTAFIREELDVVLRLIYDQYKTVENESWCQTLQIPALRYFILILNKKNYFLKDLRVREAIDMAIDREGLINNVFQGNARIITNPLFKENMKKTVSAYNPDKALKLLHKCGFQDKNNDGILEKDNKPLKFKLCINLNSIDFKKIAQIIKLQLKEIGIAVEIEVIDNEKDYNKSISKNMSFDLGIDMKPMFFDESSLMYWIKGMGFKSFILSDNKNYNQLYWKMIKANDKEQKVNYYQQLIEMIHQEKHSLFLVQPYYIHAFNKRLDISGTSFASWYLLQGLKDIIISPSK